MRWWPKKQKNEDKREKKRLRTGLVVVFALGIIIVGGLVKNYWSTPKLKDLFWQTRQIIRPLPAEDPEKILAQNLQRSGIELIYLSVTKEDQIEASLSGGIKVIFPTKDLAKKVTSLQIMLERFKIEGRLPKNIDLRFEKPVVIFKDKEKNGQR